MKDCRKYADLSGSGKWETTGSLAMTTGSTINICSFNYFTFAHTGATTFNKMCGRTAGSGKGDTINLGIAATVDKCA
jgi:hypothetical protein